MENAADALKIAFAMLIFIASLSLAFMGITQAVEVSGIVVRSVDRAEFYPDHIYVPIGNGQIRVVRQHDEATIMYITERGRNRIVGREVVIANLYRYNVEQFAVIIRDGTVARNSRNSEI